jgi:very-short-patch-repair endonuclease
MEPTIEIVEVFEQNKGRDFAFYECGLLHKNLDLPQYIDDEKELILLVNDDLYSKYNSDDFIISLDDIWRFLGYNQKAGAKRVLEEQFILNKDYKVVIQEPPLDKTIKCKKCRGGHNKEKIVLTLKTYNLFCLKSNTQMGHKMQEYYVALEQMVIKTLNDEYKLFLKNEGYDPETMYNEDDSVKNPECEMQQTDEDFEPEDDNGSDENKEDSESKFTKSLEDLIPYLTNHKEILVRHLLKNYKENNHFIIIKHSQYKIKGKHGGQNKITYMLTEFAYELLKNSFNLRNRYIVDMSENIKSINIGMCIENQTIGFIANSFDTIMNCERQFAFNQYKVDLFFPEIKLIIECDENNHKDRCIIKEREREDYLVSLGNSLIRFNPNDSKFELSNVLKEINKFIFLKSENITPVVISLP